jgi:Ca2+-binding RTX toxin-like protein
VRVTDSDANTHDEVLQIAVADIDGVTIKGSKKNDTINGTKTVKGQHVFATGEEDTISGGRGNDKISSLGGNDTVSGGRGNDKLEGGDGDDLLKGGVGNDKLIGGLGTDTLFGNGGADKFIFALGDSTTAATDTIADFKHSQLDKIDLRLIDADTGLGGDQKFHFIGGAGFTGNHAAGAAGQLRFDTASHLVEGDTDGDGNADFAIHVNVAHLVKGDFLL